MGGQRGSHLLLSLPSSSASRPPQPSASPPLSSTVLFVELVWDCVRDGAWRDAAGQNEGGKRVKVTGACPPSLTARMPSPHPLHLKNNNF